MPSYPRNYPFYNWVPKWLGILILVLLFIPILTVDGGWNLFREQHRDDERIGHHSRTYHLYQFRYFHRYGGFLSFPVPFGCTNAFQSTSGSMVMWYFLHSAGVFHLCDGVWKGARLVGWSDYLDGCLVYVYRGTDCRIVWAYEISRHNPFHGNDDVVFAYTHLCNPTNAL